MALLCFIRCYSFKAFFYQKGLASGGGAERRDEAEEPEHGEQPAEAESKGLMG